MKRYIEPGILPVFRFFSVLQFLFLCMTIVSFSAFEKPKHPMNLIVGMAALTALLILYLFLPGLERRLGTYYLPLAIFLAAFIPLGGEVIAIGFGPMSGYAEINDEAIALLLLPLLVISWQYPFPVVAGFVIAIGLLDIVLYALAFLHTGQSAMIYYHRQIVGRTLAFLAGGYLITWLMKEQRAQRRSLARANAELSHYAVTLEQLTVSRERNRMARELHDTLAHTLSGIAVQLEAMRSLWDSEPQEARSLLDQSLSLARNGLTETRSALRALRATPLEDMGLVLAMKELAESAARRAGLKLDFMAPEHPPELDGDVEHGIYRIFQEVLENVVRHAGACSLSVRLGCQGGTTTLEVGDDGCGFDPREIPLGQFGLRGIQERAAMLGGSLQIDSEEGKGTRIVLSLPAAPEEEQK